MSSCKHHDRPSRPCPFCGCGPKATPGTLGAPTAPAGSGKQEGPGRISCATGKQAPHGQRPPTFTTLATISGYEVIDSATGRPVALRSTLRSASGTAWGLNQRARAGLQPQGPWLPLPEQSE